MQIQIPIPTTWHQVPVISLAIFEFNGWISWGPFNSLGLQKIRRTIQFNVLPLGLDTRDTEQNKAACLKGIWTPAKRIYNTDGIWSRSFYVSMFGRKVMLKNLWWWDLFKQAQRALDAVSVCKLAPTRHHLFAPWLTSSLHPWRSSLQFLYNTRPDPQSFNRP